MSGSRDGGAVSRFVTRMRRRLPARRGAADAGTGRFEDFEYADLRPKNRDVTVRVADSDPHQDELRTTLERQPEEVWAMISRRSTEEERTDAPMPVRLFVTGRVSGVVGIVPRGLEAPIESALVRLSESGKPPRIPASVVTARGRLRVDLLLGETR